MAHQGQANPLSLESSDSDRLSSTKYLHPRNWFTGLGGFYETKGRFSGHFVPPEDEQKTRHTEPRRDVSPVGVVDR